MFSRIRILTWSCFCQVQSAHSPSLSLLLSPCCILLFPCFLSLLCLLFLLLHLFLCLSCSSHPHFRVVYAVVSACCFHVCFFARVSFTALPPHSLSSLFSFPLLLVTSSCASYSRQVCFICITNQPRASENLRKATYFTFLYHLPPFLFFSLLPPVLPPAYTPFFVHPLSCCLSSHM